MIRHCQVTWVPRGIPRWTVDHKRGHLGNQHFHRLCTETHCVFFCNACGFRQWGPSALCTEMRTATCRAPGTTAYRSHGATVASAAICVKAGSDAGAVVSNTRRTCRARTRRSTFTHVTVADILFTFLTPACIMTRRKTMKMHSAISQRRAQDQKGGATSVHASATIYRQSPRHQNAVAPRRAQGHWRTT